MLQITVPSTRYFNEKTSEFFDAPEKTLQLEHSLVSISKWESKWQKPFIDSEDKTREQILDYIKCMTLTQNVDPSVYSRLSPQNVTEITDYINSKMSATWFSDDKQTSKKPFKKEVITSELIYYWMVALNIPFECQKWHLNRLLTLIRICNIKNQPEKKMGKHATMSKNKALNEMRKAKLGTHG